LGGGRERCFFEKKRQKTFAKLGVVAPEGPKPPVNESILRAFFQQSAAVFRFSCRPMALP
jgi:hypothetical protein